MIELEQELSPTVCPVGGRTGPFLDRGLRSTSTTERVGPALGARDRRGRRPRRRVLHVAATARSGPRRAAVPAARRQRGLALFALDPQHAAARRGAGGPGARLRPARRSALLHHAPGPGGRELARLSLPGGEVETFAVGGGPTCAFRAAAARWSCSAAPAAAWTGSSSCSSSPAATRCASTITCTPPTSATASWPTR